MVLFLFLITLIHMKKLIGLNINKIFLKDKKFITFSKTNLNKWMNLTKKERYNLTKKESASYLNKRKILLEEIRKEYKKISKNDFEKT